MSSRTDKENYAYITFEVTKKFRETITEYAKSKGITRSELIRQAIANQIQVTQ